MAPALALSLVAVAQLVGVERDGISRWRGGGMGMYSEFHPNRTELWALADAVPVPVEALPPASWRADCPSADQQFRCTRVPTAACLEALAACLDPASPVTRLEAWRPAFSPADRAFTMELAAHAER